MANYNELSKCVQIEHDKLLNDDNRGDQHISTMDNSLQESTSLLEHSPNSVSSVIIEVATENRIETSVTVQIQIPIAIIIISLLEIGYYMLDSMNRNDGYYSLPARILLFSSANKIDLWRYITYMFVHQDKLHLGMNVVFQLMGGVALEITHGWWRIIIVYLAGVLAGSLGVESMSRCKALVGASAGVYAILGAHFSTLILNWKETENRVIRIFILLVYVLTDVFNLICIVQIAHNAEFGSFSCTFVSELTNTTITHFCGFWIGTLTAMIVLVNSRVHLWERMVQAIVLFMLVLIISLAICLIIFIPDFDIKNLIGCDR